MGGKREMESRNEYEEKKERRREIKRAEGTLLTGEGT